ncbi:MAG: amidase [Porticoccaceae bacterium]
MKLKGAIKMPVRAPTIEQLKQVAESLHMKLSESEIQSHHEIMAPNFDAYNALDMVPDYLPEVKYPRTPGHEPQPEDNLLNAWVRKTSVVGATDGILSGHKVVLKDNISLAGVPMTNGSSTLNGYVPDIDATVVARILDAGGEIVGKAHCEHFCLSGGSHTNSRVSVLNPHNPNYSSGGSSSGCGALVGSGEIKMAIGGDQGGSVRIPASWSGCVGMKASWGLVPYTGIISVESTIDYTGPITDTVRNNALLLTAIAGPDGLDARQYGADLKTDYRDHLDTGIKGKRIAVLTEGFGRENSEEDVDILVRQAIDALKAQGAEVVEVSIPGHVLGQSIWLAIALEGLTAQMMTLNGVGTGWRGMYPTGLLDAHAAWRLRANDLSDSLKSCMLTGQYMLDEYHGRYYAKAQNLSRKLIEDYNSVLKDFDTIALPTIPMKATPLPKADADMALYVQRAFEMIGNTCQFDVTGHPAISIPVGMSNGLPVGMMLVGAHNDEANLYQIANAYESENSWREIRT